MLRRAFIALACALPFAVQADPIDYTPGLVTERLAAGETVFLDFKASWCTTCRAQERVIDALKAENPAYEENVTFINIDWDDYGNSELVRSLNVPRRSTLIAIQGEQELGRIVAGTAQSEIQALMDAALEAASGNS